MLEARSYEEGSVHSLKRSKVIEESENQSSRLNEQIDCKKRENNWRQID